MIAKYECEVTCVCPVDGMPDVYKLTVVAGRTIPVETILDVVKSVADRKMYQEELCQFIHRKINAACLLIGYHSGVKTTVQCGPECIMEVTQ